MHEGGPWTPRDWRPMKEERDTDTRRDVSHVMTEAEVRAGRVHLQGWREPSETGRASGGGAALTTPLFEVQASDSKRADLHCFKPPTLW